MEKKVKINSFTVIDNFLGISIMTKKIIMLCLVISPSFGMQYQQLNNDGDMFNQNPNMNTLNQNQNWNMHNQNPNMNMHNQNPNMNIHNQNPNMNMHNQNPNMNMLNQNLNRNMFNQNPNMNMFNQNLNRNMFNQNQNWNMHNQNPNMNMFNQNPNMNMHNQNPNMNMFNQNPNMNMHNQNPNMNMFNQNLNRNMFNQNQNWNMHNQNPNMNMIPFTCGNGLKINKQYTIQLTNDESTQIERAGVLLAKTYNEDSKNNYDRYVFIMGHDKNQNFICPFSGKVDVNQDKFSTDTAVRELKEETGNAIQLKSSALKDCPYIFAGKKQLFVWKDDEISVDTIKRHNQKAQSNQQLSYDYKEVDSSYAIPAINLIELGKKITNGEIKFERGSNATYPITSRNGISLQINAYYMNMFGHPEHKERIKHAKLLFEATFGVDF